VNIPVAKTVEDTEYKQLLKRHEMLEKLEKEDALIALHLLIYELLQGVMLR